MFDEIPALSGRREKETELSPSSRWLEGWKYNTLGIVLIIELLTGKNAKTKDI